MNKNLLILLCMLLSHFNISGQTTTEKTITGQVSDNFFNETLIGVSVVIEGTLRGTTTDVNGNYTINVPGPESVLVFSYINVSDLSNGIYMLRILKDNHISTQKVMINK